METQIPTTETAVYSGHIHPAKLQKRETEILLWLSMGWSYERICTHTGMRDDCLHVHCYNIRKKTGIQSTRNADECRDYLRHRRAQPAPPEPRQPLSWTQTEVLRLLAMGDSYERISKTLGMGVQTAQNHACEACKRVGIVARGRHSRAQAIKDYVDRLDGKEPTVQLQDPMF